MYDEDLILQTRQTEQWGIEPLSIWVLYSGSMID